MTYSTGTITSATPGQAWIAALGTAITAVTGWSKVTAARVEGTITWDVFKCAGANNSFGSDFYVALGYITASALTVKVAIFEGWNTGTFLASNYPPNAATTPTVTTWVNPGAAQALPSTTSTMSYSEINFNLVTTGFNYGISVTTDRIWFWGLSGANNVGFYAGLYEPFLPIASDPFPICLVQLAPLTAGSGGNNSTPTATTGVCTRAPLQTTSALQHFGCGTIGTAANAWNLNNSTTAEAYTGKIILTRCLLYGNTNSYFRGLLKDCFMGPTQSQNGDTMTWTLNGVNHTSSRLGGILSFAIYGDQL